METLSEEKAEEQIYDDSSSGEEDELMNIPSGKNPKTPSSVVQGRTAVSSAVNQVSDMNPSKPGKKRPSEKTSNEVNAKRAVKNVEDTKKSLFHRLWSKEDEISLLQSMIDFMAETGYSPYEDMEGFYELAMKSISFEVSKSQFVKTIGSLKDKYMRKVKYIWGVEFFSKAHDTECLKLAKCIWGLESAIKSNGIPKKSEKKLYSLEANGKRVEEDRDVLVNGKKVEEDKDVLIHGGDSKSLGARASDWFEDSFLVRSIASLGVDEQFVKHKWSMVTTETKPRMGEKWKLLQAKEMEIVLQKTDFMREVGSVIAKT